MSLANIAILVFASTSYIIGFYAILKRGYRPNVFTRVVFLCLALNSLASVIKLSNQSSTLTLAWVMFFGSVLIFIGSLIFKGERLWGKTETIATILLAISLLFWVFTNIPLLNLCIGLIAHLLGSLPTVTRVIKQPEKENASFWLFFAFASIVALISTNTGNVKDYIFAIYFCIFDGSMTILTYRKYFIRSIKIA